MNILILNWKDIKNDSRGGAEVIAFEFAKRLVKEGHTVTFFSRNFPNAIFPNNIPNALDEETIDGVRIVRKGNRITVYLHAFFYYRSLKKKPDKVIDMVNTICWQTPLYVPREKRILYVNQLAKEICFFELLFPFSWIAYFLERFEYVSYRNTQTVCYSKSTRDDLLQFGIPKKNISIFPMGLDHERYKKGNKSKQPLFVFVARLVKMKRADLCIKAIAILKKKVPEVKLAIIGNGDEEKKLEQLVERLHLKKNVTFVKNNNFFLSKKPHDIKIEYMQSAWALLLPSVKEGWGMVVTEAAACSTPSIVTDVTGLKDSVIDKKTGILIPSTPTPEMLAKAMLAVFNEKKRKELSENAQKFSNEFSWEQSYTAFKKIILQGR